MAGLACRNFTLKLVGEYGSVLGTWRVPVNVIDL